ncbi:MAG: hypothetical protein QM662_02200 [Gordonia sp. (in: high G+C Gram-positive bacteria)]
MARRWFIASIAAAMATAATLVGPGAVSATPGCPTVTVTTHLDTPGLLGWSENLTVDERGTLWVSRTLAGVVSGYDAHGRLRTSVRVPSPGSVRQGPDGDLYVAAGDTPLNMIPGTPRTGRILRFDPQATHPVTRTFAAGLGMPNGMDFDARGNLYVADTAVRVTKIRPDGTVDRRWTAAAPANLAPSATINGTGTNGVAVVGDDVYVTLTSSLSGRVLRVPIAAPARTGVAADLTAPLPGVLDDLVALDAHILAVAATPGQVHLVDLRTGRRCTTSTGLPVTALARVPGRPGILYAGTETGQVLRLRLR